MLYFGNVRITNLSPPKSQNLPYTAQNYPKLWIYTPVRIGLFLQG